MMSCQVIGGTYNVGEEVRKDILQVFCNKGRYFLANEKTFSHEEEVSVRPKCLFPRNLE